MQQIILWRYDRAARTYADLPNDPFPPRHAAPPEAESAPEPAPAPEAVASADGKKPFDFDEYCRQHGMAPRPKRAPRKVQP